MFMLAGAWAVWRRNPMFSARSTLRAGIVILISVAGVVGLIVGALKLTEHSSTTVSATALGFAVVIGTLFFIFFIQIATVPSESKPSSLPHAVKLVTDNRRKTYRWLKLFAILILVFAVGGLLPGPARYISLTLGGLTLFLAVILLPVFYFTNRGFDQSLTAIELNPWVHWRYTADEWQQWSIVQADRLRATPPTFLLSRDWRRFIFPFSVIIFGVTIFCPGSWLFRGIYVAVVCALILAFAVIGGRGGAAYAEKLHTHLLTAPRDVYFGRDGVFADGVFTPWINVSTYLVSAAIDPRQPASLMLNFERGVPNPYGPAQTIHIHQAVLIPADAGADLARLQQELTARCPEAQIALT